MRNGGIAQQAKNATSFQGGFPRKPIPRDEFCLHAFVPFVSPFFLLRLIDNHLFGDSTA